MPPAVPTDLADLVTTSPVQLPSSYLAFLRESNGGEGELGAQPGWFVLWPAGEVMRSNREYHVQEYLPGFLGIGSSGGGQLLAFDTRQGQPYPVTAVPFVPMEMTDALLVAASFEEFLGLMGKTWEER